MSRLQTISIAVFLILSLLLSLSSCGGDTYVQKAAPTGTPTTGGVVYRHLESDCKTLNWVLYNTVYENYVLRYLYDTLLDYDQNLDVIPVLHEEVVVCQGAAVIVFEAQCLEEVLVHHQGAC